MWAGDSRAYVFRDGELIRLTRDHTQVEDMLDARAAERRTRPPTTR